MRNDWVCDALIWLQHVQKILTHENVSYWHIVEPHYAYRPALRRLCADSTPERGELTVT